MNAHAIWPFGCRYLTFSGSRAVADDSMFAGQPWVFGLQLSDSFTFGIPALIKETRVAAFRHLSRIAAVLVLCKFRWKGKVGRESYAGSSANIWRMLLLVDECECCKPLLGYASHVVCAPLTTCFGNESSRADGIAPRYFEPKQCSFSPSRCVWIRCWRRCRFGRLGRSL